MGRPTFSDREWLWGDKDLIWMTTDVTNRIFEKRAWVPESRVSYVKREGYWKIVE